MASKTKYQAPDKAELELEKLRENRSYRFKLLLGDDWPEDDIQALVVGPHHPTDLEKLLKAGCPPRTALRILI